MDCPKCGKNMEKGGVMLKGRMIIYRTPTPHLAWFDNKTLEEFGRFPKSLLLRPDLKIYGEMYKMGYYKYEAYRCENCGAILVIPPENDGND